MKKHLSLENRTHVSRVARDWDLSDTLPTELWRRGKLPSFDLTHLVLLVGKTKKLTSCRWCLRSSS